MDSKEVKGLMEAYASVYEGEQLDEFLGPKAAKVVGSAFKKGQEGLEKMGVPINRQKRGTVTKQEQDKKIKKNIKDDVDLFDAIKSHLLDEGFADNEESALVIMANMSEEWKASIFESIARGSAPNSPTGNIGGAASKYAGSLLKKGAEFIKKNMSKSDDGYSTRPGDGKPYREGPLWDGPDMPAKKSTPKRKTQGAPMRDEPLW